MNIVIVGYGRVGSTLARELLAAGHHITIIEKDAERIQRALRLEGAQVISGSAVDVQVQREAGVSTTNVFLAVTSNDNVNLVAAQIAIEVFQVSHVVARVYTPSRADISVDRGITTVCPTRFTVDKIWEEVREAAEDGTTLTRTNGSSRGRDAAPVVPIDESKFVVVAGGGRVGFHLARTLRRNGHEVVLIERDPRIAQNLRIRLDCPVIVGDGSMRQVLEEAGVARCRVFAAVTGQDEDNLVACQTARVLWNKASTEQSESGAPAKVKTIARISDPNNEDLYRALGVDATVSATSIIESVIERELPTLRIKTLLSLQEGGVSILEFVLPDHAPAIAHQVRDIVLPRDSNLVALVRQGGVLIPRGDTVFHAGDIVVVIATRDSEAAVKEVLLGVEENPGESAGEHEHEARPH